MGDLEMITILLDPSRGSAEQRARLLEARGRDGWTALGLTVRSGNLALAKALLEAGASPTQAAVASGKTALEIARANRRPAMIELLER